MLRRVRRLSDDPDRRDYSVFDDGVEIGRVYRNSTSRRALPWFWSIIALGPARAHVETDGRAATLEQAKTQFRENWDAFKDYDQKHWPVP
jgi:hypothetical protein